MGLATCRIHIAVNLNGWTKLHRNEVLSREATHSNKWLVQKPRAPVMCIGVGLKFERKKSTVVTVNKELSFRLSTDASLLGQQRH
eukprot:5904848-Amphidinium_carterae.1